MECLANAKEPIPASDTFSSLLPLAEFFETDLIPWKFFFSFLGIQKWEGHFNSSKPVAGSPALSCGGNTQETEGNWPTNDDDEPT